MRDSRSQFLALLVFMLAVVLVLGNGFAARIFAQGQETDVFQQIQPIGNVLDEVLTSYVREPDTDKLVEGAIRGMMNSLDDHSSYLPKEAFDRMQEETDGEFDGIGIVIGLNDDKIVSVFQVIEGAPAAKAGMLPGDIILSINDISTDGMAIDEARDHIRGPNGTPVHLTVLRRYDDPKREADILEIDVVRGKVPFWSVAEHRMLPGDGGIGYIRVTDFKKTTADEIAEKLEGLKKEGMKALIIDLRSNPGGLLTASKEAAELFLPKGTLVTYTKGRNGAEKELAENLRLTTERKPILPESLPIVLLVNDLTASSAEIVTGALQYWERALVVGMKTYGKGSVQTIIPLARPEGSAIRLTTALYYTPAEVTIDKEGILPDVEVLMSKDEWRALQIKIVKETMAVPPDLEERLMNSGGESDGPKVTPENVVDTQLERAVQLLREEPVFEKLIAKYHKDTHLTQHAHQEEQTPATDAAAPAQSGAAPAEDTPAEEAPAEPPVTQPTEPAPAGSQS